MPGIHIKQFSGIMPEIAERNMPNTCAQVAHNCLLRDGSLRPLPEWKLFGTTGNGYIVENILTWNLHNVNYTQAVFLSGPPFAKNIIVGVSDDEIRPDGYTGNIFQTANLSSTAGNFPSGIPTPTMSSEGESGPTAGNVFNTNINFRAGLYSQKPVNRILGLTFCRQIGGQMQEGPIGVFANQSPQQLMFEGDILELYFRLNMGYMHMHGITHVRLYRTVAGLDSGEKAGNELDTDWHLIRTIPVREEIRFNDGGAATTDPMDLYLAGNFYEPKHEMQYFGLSEGGWFYAVNWQGKVSISERYLHHAWPVENYLDISKDVMDAVCHYDNIYIGTSDYPFVVSLGPGEGQQGLQAAATRFPARLPCLGGTMVASPGGAIYASTKGLVALGRSGQQVITAGLTNADDQLYKLKGDIDIRFAYTVKAAYHDGAYWGFTHNGYGYTYQTGDETHGDNKFGQLVTFDAPPVDGGDGSIGAITQALVTVRGLTANGGNRLYYLPLPGDGIDLREYNKAKKKTYTWKSKKFVFPGYMTLAAGKLVHDCGGKIHAELWVDCKMVWSDDICDCEPFRLPTNIIGREFEILVSGQRRLYEIHFASSMQELTED